MLVSEFGGVYHVHRRKEVLLVQVAEKHHCAVEITFHGPSGHGSVPVKDSAMYRWEKRWLLLMIKGCPFTFLL
jgi:hypothetical protein